MTEKVTLVGAGRAGAELLTLEGAAAIEKATRSCSTGW